MNTLFEQRLHALQQEQERLLQRPNKWEEETNGIVRRYRYPVLTAAHIPLAWRYDLNPETNPYCLERIGVNACLNSGAIKWNGKYLLMVRVEGAALAVENPVAPEDAARLDPARLTERFYQGDPSRTGHGTGLGLAVARALTESMGGTLAVGVTAGERPLFSARVELRPAP